MSRSPSGSSRTATCQFGPCSSSSGRARQSSRIGASVIAAGSPASRPEQRRLGPVDVVDDHDQRPFVGLSSQEVADRPLGLRGGRGALGEPEQLRDLRRDDADVRAALDVRLDERPRLRDRMLVVDAGQLAHDLADRPERDAFAVRKAPAAHDPRTGADACETNSAVKRDFPTPGSPTTVTSRHSRRPTTASNSRSSSCSWSSRPANGVPARRGTGPTSLTSRSR